MPLLAVNVDHVATVRQARLAASLGVSEPTVGRYIDLLCDLHLTRRLTPWAANVGKRLVRTPKVYVRDSGLVHALLGLGTGLARSRHGPPGGAQLARQLQAQRMLLCHDLGLAAGSLGALRSFLARQPQRNGHFDLPFALALVGVKAVARGSQ